MSSLLPFLYQTRTILRPRRLPTTTLVRRSLHLTPLRRRDDHHIPFAKDGPEDEVPIEEQTQGTITPAERQTFERIFSDIATRGLKPNAKKDLPPPSPTAQRSTNLIIEKAAIDAGQHQPDAIMSPLYYAATATDKNKALLRFPPSLRAAARRAFELLKPDHPAVSSQQSSSDTTEGDEAEDSWGTPKNTLQRVVELDAKRHPEQMRVEDLMKGATSDFELWDIMEREVFSYPDKLGLRRKGDEPQSIPTITTTQEGAKRSESKQHAPKTQLDQRDLENQTIEINPTSADEPQANPKLNLYVYGPLYPAFLLLGLRLLDRSFSKPSTLALNVLPRIKELGLESFVLGVSTPFYNELLDIYYSRYGDLSKMLDLLEEMRHSGLYFDGETTAVLGRAQAQTNALATGGHGAFATAFMTMPEYEKSMRERIKHWHRAVDISTSQRDRDTDYEQLYHS